tara:strand:- start:3044 stop:4282 length:1239 start_codon:yes stop_codon:yes gene_type:complete
MGTRLITRNWKVEGVLTNVSSAKLSDPTGTYGVKRNDTGATVVADGTSMTNPSTGVYEYSFTDTVGIAYTAYVEIVYSGATYHFEVDLPASTAAGAMTASYSSLLERIGKFAYGIKTGFSADQTSDIEMCIRDGLHDVYSAYAWSFFRPIEDISTTAPYATGTVTIASGVVTLSGGTFPSWAEDGLLKVSDSYYSVATRDSNTQVTLDDTTVAVSAASGFELGRPEIPLPATFEAIANDSALTYYPDQNELYPPVRQRHDQDIRTRQQNDPYYDRPVFYSVRTVEFDPDVGSRRRIALYPTPDKQYVLRVPMILRPLPISASDQYPVGGETLSQLITESCLAAAERNYDEQDGRHTTRFQQLLPLAIAADKEKSSATSLGADAPRGESRHGEDYRALRATRMGSVTLDGTTL